MNLENTILRAEIASLKAQLIRAHQMHTTNMAEIASLSAKCAELEIELMRAKALGPYDEEF